MPFQVFIGASSKDYELAQRVFDFPTAHAIEVFFSRESLPRLGHHLCLPSEAEWEKGRGALMVGFIHGGIPLSRTPE